MWVIPIGAHMGQKETEDLYASRMRVCKPCEHIKTGLLRAPSCNLCGCNLSLKARVANAECPLGKWPQ